MPIPARLLPLAVLTLATVSACSDSTGNGGGGGGGTTTLTVSAATPTSGNGSLSGINIVPGDAGTMVDVLVTGTVGSVNHSIEFLALKADGSLVNVEHKWGADLNNPDGWTICDANGGSFPVCDAAHYSVDLNAQKVTLNGLVLGAAQADGDASTLTGTGHW